MIGQIFPFPFLDEIVRNFSRDGRDKLRQILEGYRQSSEWLEFVLEFRYLHHFYIFKHAVTRRGLGFKIEVKINVQLLHLPL